MQALPDSPESLCLSEMGGTESRDGEVGVQGQLYLNIGLHNGVLLRTVVDQVTGDLSDTRTRQGYLVLIRLHCLSIWQGNHTLT
jgi:splicing factor 3B subunit 3